MGGGCLWAATMAPNKGFSDKELSNQELPEFVTRHAQSGSSMESLG